MHAPCVVIPSYNHAEALPGMLERIFALDLPVILVDDASGPQAKAEFDRLAQLHSGLTLLRRPKNGGKGAAMIDGLRFAIMQGYSHALQVDADNQHDLADLPRFLKASQENPHALILGYPLFGEDVPKARLYGRQVTNFWVKIECLGNQIQDALFGYRCYPLKPVDQLLQRVNLGQRMDFDPEIAVRLCWMGVKIINLPSRVSYHSGGLSHFHPWRDNVLLSLRHSRLVTGMLLRLPKLLAQKGLQERHG